MARSRRGDVRVRPAIVGAQPGESGCAFTGGVTLDPELEPEPEPELEPEPEPEPDPVPDPDWITVIWTRLLFWREHSCLRFGASDALAQLVITVPLPPAPPNTKYWLMVVGFGDGVQPRSRWWRFDVEQTMTRLVPPPSPSSARSRPAMKARITTAITANATRSPPNSGPSRSRW